MVNVPVYTPANTSLNAIVETIQATLTSQDSSQHFIQLSSQHSIQLSSQYIPVKTRISQHSNQYSN